MKVFPLADGLCPACGRTNFNLDTVDEETVAAARAAADLATRVRVHQAAVLHWQLVWSLAAAIALVIGRVYFRRHGTETLGLPAFDEDLVVIIVSAAALAAVAFTWRSATALARTIQLVPGNTRTPNMFTVLKESMGFFEDRHIPTGLLGPRMRAFAPSPQRNSVE